jgi:hypothetical protein
MSAEVYVEGCHACIDNWNWEHEGIPALGRPEPHNHHGIEPWSVYESATGTVWSVTPPTEAHARHEAELAGVGHEAHPNSLARALANAWAHGRQAALRTQPSEPECQAWYHGQPGCTCPEHTNGSGA